MGVMIEKPTSIIFHPHLLTPPMDVYYVFIMCKPAGRSFIGPLPPGIFAARLLAAVILPPLLFFAILNTSLNCLVSLVIVIHAALTYSINIQCKLRHWPKDMSVRDSPLTTFPEPS
jgi:hypothetical protein